MEEMLRKIDENTADMITRFDEAQKRIVEEEEVIVINKSKPLEQHIKQLSKSFSKMNTNQMFIKPLLRQLIKNSST